jgi:hypothetical protein
VAAASERTTGLDETELPADAGGWLPLRGKSGHARAVDRVAASGGGCRVKGWFGVRVGDENSGMPQNFIAVDRDQSFLMAPSLRDWLADDHLAWTVLAAVVEMDLDAFYGAYRPDGHGRPAYDPSMGWLCCCSRIAAEVNADSPDFGHLDPIVSAAQSELEAAGVVESPGIVVADAGYWHQVQMEAVVDRGMQVIIPPDAAKRKGARPGWDGGLYAFMRRVVASDAGGELYRKRQGMIEPVFAQVKFNRKIDRFQRRGRAAVRSEWRLIAATHTLLKLHNHQIAIARA